MRGHGERLQEELPMPRTEQTLLQKKSHQSGPLEHSRRYAPPLQETTVTTLGHEHDKDARNLIRRALKDAWPAARQHGWSVSAVVELEPEHQDVGYMDKDGTLFLKVRDPTAHERPCKGRGEGTKERGQFYPYSFILATMLHELTHLSYLGHGKAFYQCLHAAVRACGVELPSALRQEVHRHICAELLNAVCDNDQRRARALLRVMPEAAKCPRPGGGPSLPLDYAAQYGRVALTSLLLEARADVDPCRGVPPLARAAAQGNAKTAKVLLAAGASITSVEPDLRPVLQPLAATAPEPVSTQQEVAPTSWKLRKQSSSSLPRLSKNLMAYSHQDAVLPAHWPLSLSGTLSL
mmetsp:Transcript_21452/g.49116  ORF Transcript_21452/g.49116 Transcript_21452/m.49116 type:complete len:350 (+) Transcript_21452:58-1107(+)